MKTIRAHYSWSQQSLFKASKLSFYKTYVLGESKKPNIRFDKGKEFGRYKETGEIPHWVDDPLLEEVADQIPNLDYKEQEVLVDFFKDREEDKPEWYKPLLMYTDSCKKDLSEFHEYKTGKVPWTQDTVNKHGQLDVYAAGFYILSGQKVLPTCRLYWIETEDVPMTDGSIKIRYTGHVEEFERKFSEEEILASIMDILTTQETIDNWEYKELEIEQYLIDKYIKLSEEKVNAESEMNLIKLQVESLLLENRINYGVGKGGVFSFSSRKSYSFSEKLEDLQEKYKTEINKNKALEKKNGTAEISENKYLTFRKSKN